MSLTIKLTSLFIRTAAKPIGNWIKSQAREHERFRRICVSFAQRLHRVDMRLRLGLLQDNEAIERQIAREAAERKAAEKAAAVPTVKTEAQMKADEAAAAKDKAKGGSGGSGSAAYKPRIRPLSESKAIDSGANFISETFLFLVAAGLLVGESWRSRRKENVRREDVADRLAALEAEVERVRAGEQTAEEEVERLKGEILRLSSSSQSESVANKGTESPKRMAGDRQRQEKESANADSVK